MAIDGQEEAGVFVPCSSVTLVGLQGHSGAEVKGGMTECQLITHGHFKFQETKCAWLECPGPGYGWACVVKIGKGDKGWVMMTSWGF